MNVKILNEKLVKVPKFKFEARQTSIISSMSKQLGKFLRANRINLHKKVDYY